MRPTLPALPALVLVAGLVAACGGGDGDGAAPPPGDGPETMAATPPEPPAHRSEVYADPAHWLCRPDTDDDACDVDLDATLVRADGTTEVEPFQAAADAPVDCFYLYPTTSNQPTGNSELTPTDAEVQTVQTQAARFGEVCRIFAPMYRQVTLPGIFGNAETPPDWELAYADVVDAWRHYLANDNGGRGVVLLGHSQGSRHLIRLLAEEIEPDAGERGRLVSAVVTGWALGVPEGEDVGGHLDEIALCRRPDQTGCAVAYATFRSDEPPPEGANFAVVRDDEGGDALRSACVNPAAPGGGGPVPLDSVLRVDALPDGAVGPEVTTPFVRFEGLAEAACVDDGPFTYLEAEIGDDPDDVRPHDLAGRITPEGGLHLLDLNLPMGSLVDLVAEQPTAYLDG